MTFGQTSRGLPGLLATAKPETLSSSSARVKRLRRLIRDAKTRSSERAFVVEGEKSVSAALASQLSVQQLFVGQSFVPRAPKPSGRSDGAGEEYSVSTLNAEVECFEIADSVFASVLDSVSPQLIAAVVTQPVWETDHVEDGNHMIAAVEIRDPGNLGTIVRTLEASGGSGLVIVGPSVDHYNPKVVRASAGSILRMPILVLEGVADLVSLAAETDRCVVATVVTDSAPVYDTVDLSRAIIMVGNEPRGLSDTDIAAADSVVTIPTADTVESLNVAAATAVLCFESARQARSN